MTTRRYIATIVLAVAALGCFCAPMDGCAASTLCSEECEQEGKCSITTALAGESIYRCYVSDPESCAESVGCREGGKCHYVPAIQTNGCVALTHQDCLESEMCKRKGACELNQGRCSISSAGCTRSDICRRESKCHLRVRSVPVDGTPDAYTRTHRCVAKDVPDEDWCTKACETSGACVRQGDACVAIDDEHCESSSACSRHGLCSVGESGACVAASDEDCAQSRDCKKDGYCLASDRGSWCVSHNEACSGAGCKYSGQCSAYKGACQAVEDSDCAASDVCRMDGRCAVKERRCWPTSNEHCRESEICHIRGRCGYSGNTCMPTDSTHCEESLACEIAGLCSLWSHDLTDDRRCHAGSAADCEQSIECQRFGRCVPRYLPNCTREGCRKVCSKPSGPVLLSCVETRYCKEEGRCVRLDIPPDGSNDGPWPKSQDCARRQH